MRTIKAWTRLAVIASAVLFVAACGGGGGGSYSGGGTNVMVPNVVGMAQAAATSSITGAGLTLGTVTMANSSSVAAGNVISENPAAGASVASGSAVALTVSSGPAPVAVPNVVGDTLAAASTAITTAGLKVGTETMANSNSVAAGDVISTSPVGGTNVAPGSSVNLTVSTGPNGVPVPNVVGDTVPAASTAITNAGLKVGTETMQSSNSVAAGDVISTSPAAGTQVAAGSTVNLTVSSGPPVPHFAYVANSSDATISAYSFDPSTGATTPLGAATPVTGNCSPCKPGSLQEIKVDPSGKYVYVVSQADDNVYGFSINPANGSLTALSTSPFGTGIKPVSLAFDATGAFLYVLNVLGDAKGQDSISGFSLTAATGALTPLGTPTPIGNGHNPGQFVSVKVGNNNYIYVALTNANSIDLFTINPGPVNAGSLSEVASAYPSDVGPFGLAVDPAGTVLYSANTAGTISAFMISKADGSLTPFCTPFPPCVSKLQLTNPVTSDIGIDPQGKYLFVTEVASGKGYVDVWPIDSNSATGLGAAAVTGSPFATGGINPNAISFDSTGQWVFSGNDGSANFAEFSLNGATGVLAPVAGSPIAAGNNPDFIVID